MKKFLDRYYKYLRPLRPLYGWFIDARRRQVCSKRAEEWKSRGYRGAKLDVCGGRNPFNPEEFLNVDIVALPQVDLVFDITKRFPIDSSVIAEILSVATLEHLRKPQVHHVLQEFFRILAPRGVLRISTPDIEAIAQGILDHGDLDVLNQHLFGRFKSEETEDLDLHKWMYPAPQMISVLQELGFVDVERIPLDLGMHDPRLNYLIRARKP
ncbi:MAG: hypothetical protein WCG83_01150 [Candidatus Peregrinibacteria bacterium]